MTKVVHSIDIMSSGGGTDGPRRHLAVCMECPWRAEKVTENYNVAMDEATKHRIDPLSAVHAATVWFPENDVRIAGYISPNDACPVIEIDAPVGTGEIRVYVNDGQIFAQDPEEES